MAARIHFNNFTTALSSGISDIDTSFTLDDSIPAIGSSYVLLTITSGGLYEIVKVSSLAGAPTYTITRAQEGTTALSWSSGATVECRLTANSVDGKEDTLSGQSISTATVATDDKVLIQDTSDSNNLKTVTAQSIADLASTGATFGTFTPVLEGTTTAGTGTYTTQRGTYAVLGQLCFIEIYLVWTAHTGTGNMQISGLPYEGQTGLTEQVINIHKTINNVNGGSAYHYLSIFDNTTVGQLYTQGGTGAQGVQLMDTSMTFAISGFYFID